MKAHTIDGPLVSVPVVSRHGIFFWLFSTVVTVRFTFLLVLVLMAGLGRRSVMECLVWVCVATLGIVLHEFGHVAAARRYGHKPAVELYTMGGVTRWTSEHRPTWREGLVVSLAGPLIGLVLAGMVWLLLRGGTALPTHPLLWLAFHDFMWVCVGWGLFNLLPVLPLDGGRALEALLVGFPVKQPQRTAQLVSIAVGGVAAVLAFAYGWVWAGALAALFAYNNAQRVRGVPEVKIVG